MSTVSEPTFEQLALIIEEKIGVPRDRVRPGTRLKDIEIDSLALIEVALVAEEEFGAEIPTDLINLDGTVQGLYELVLTVVNSSHA
ncbi:MAG TPA: phosphopantetheine-binding protein [Streptosporangiaceae bacterium]|nr:phosphopantetheine-binding protein [Streptosporangiaceae bacterium]